MAFGSAWDPAHAAWGRMIEKLGVAAALVDFRNCEVPSETNPEIAAYSGGLNDCYSALQWCYEHAKEIGVDAPEFFMAIVPDSAMDTSQSIANFAEQVVTSSGASLSKL